MSVREEPSADDGVRAEVGRRIKERRRALRLSQNALGRQLVSSNDGSVAGTQISKWERGEHLPDRRYWRQLAAILELDFGDLLPADESNVGATRIEEVERRLEALIRVLGLGDAVDEAIRAAGRRTPREQTETSEVQEIEQAVEAADDSERENEPPAGQECETGDPPSSGAGRPTGS